MSKTGLSRRTFVRLSGAAGAAAASASAAAAATRKPVTAPAAVAMAAPVAQGDPIRVVTTQPFEPAEVRVLEEAAAPTKLEVVICGSRDEFRRELPNAEVVYGGMRQGDLDHAPKLQWIQWGSGGVENVPQDIRDHEVVLTNQARTYAPAIAETAMGLLLCLTRGITTYYHREFVQGKLEARGTVKSDDHVELAGRFMGIVGMGGIGSAIARKAHYGFEMVVTGTDAKPLPKPEYVQELYDPSQFMKMVPQVDVLVGAAPHTPETEGMFNAEVFRAMKPPAYFLLMSRGKLLNDRDLVQALREGWIAGAGLDVFPQEPPPAGHPIYDIPNVVMTPHTSGWSPDRQVRLVNLFAENLRRYANAQPLKNVVDKQKGY